MASKVWTRAARYAAAAALFSVGAAQAVPVGVPVTIQESAIPGAASNSFAADQLSGQYDEVFTATSPTTFVTEAIFNAGQWFDSGSPLSTQLNAFGAAGYGIYAKFSSTGTFTSSASGVSFIGGAGTVQLFADPDHNTVYNVATSATGNVNHLVLTSPAATTSDDFLLGTATVLLMGDGSANTGGTGTANGNFELLFQNFVLSNPGGTGYFIAPRPFNLMLDLNGNFQSFNPTSGSSTQLLNNSANAFFLPVPEPDMLALAGIALFSMAVITRRRKS